MKKRINAVILWTNQEALKIYWNRLSRELNKSFQIKLIKHTQPHTLNPFYFIKLAKEAKKCDIIHIQHNYNLFGSLFNKFHSIYAWLFYLVLKISNSPKIVTTIHDTVEPNNLRFYERIYLEFMNLPLKLFNDKIIVHTEYARNQLIRQGFNEEKIVSIPLPLCTVERIKTSKQARSKLNISEKKTIVLFGYMSPIKQYELVFNALTYLPDMQLLIIGDTLDEQYTNFLKDEVKKKRLTDRVSFIGRATSEEIYGWLSCGDVIILPYKSNTGSATLADAISTNTPVITSNLEGFKEIEEKWKAIKVTDVYSKENLARVIKETISNPEELKKNMRLYFKENNGFAIAKRTKRIYKEVCVE